MPTGTLFLVDNTVFACLLAPQLSLPTVTSILRAYSYYLPCFQDFAYCASPRSAGSVRGSPKMHPPEKTRPQGLEDFLVPKVSLPGQTSQRNLETPPSRLLSFRARTLCSVMSNPNPIGATQPKLETFLVVFSFHRHRRRRGPFSFFRVFFFFPFRLDDKQHPPVI